MVTKQDILEYVMNSPYNTNYTILKQMVEEIEGSGGSGEPKYVFNKDIIAEEGMIGVPINESYQFSNGDLIEIDFQLNTILLYIIESDDSLYAIDSNFGSTAAIFFDEHPETGVEYMIFTDFRPFNPGGGGGFTPSGSVTITSNGTTSVYDYETAIVNVPTLILNTITVSGPSGYHIKARNEYSGMASNGLTIDTTSHQFYSDPITFKIPRIINHYYYLQLASTDGKITAISGASGQTYCNRTSEAAAEVANGDNLVLTMIDN